MSLENEYFNSIKPMMMDDLKRNTTWRVDEHIADMARQALEEDYSKEKITALARISMISDYIRDTRGEPFNAEAFSVLAEAAGIADIEHIPAETLLSDVRDLDERKVIKRAFAAAREECGRDSDREAEERFVKALSDISRNDDAVSVFSDAAEAQIEQSDNKYFELCHGDRREYETFLIRTRQIDEKSITDISMDERLRTARKDAAEHNRANPAEGRNEKEKERSRA